MSQMHADPAVDLLPYVSAATRLLAAIAWIVFAIWSVVDRGADTFTVGAVAIGIVAFVAAVASARPEPTS